MRHFAVLLVGLFIVGCGGDSETKTVVKTVTEAPGETETETETDEPASKACDDKGINREGLKTGTCYEGGYRLTVVNKDDLLKLEELNAKLNGWTTASNLASGGGGGSARAAGIFVIFDLTITNKLNGPVAFDETQDQVILGIGERNFTENFDAQNGPLEDSCLWKEPSEIQPGLSKTCKVVFDVPPKAAELMTERSDKGGGNLVLFNFSDQDTEDRNRYGAFRLYN